MVHYYFGRSFMLWDDWGRVLGRSEAEDRKALFDVRLARAFGRKTFMTLQGCDARQADRSKPHQCRHHVPRGGVPGLWGPAPPASTRPGVP